MTDLPHNIEAEQALLGCILINNDAFASVAALLQPDHFFDPVHAEIYEAIVHRITASEIASPVSLKNMLADSQGLAQLGGPAYLVRLANAAITVAGVRDYARIISDLSDRRRLILAMTNACSVLTDTRVAIPTAVEGVELAVAADRAGQEKPLQTFGEAILGAMDDVVSAYTQGESSGLSTGIKALDDGLSGGMFQSDYIVLGGRPSMGKSALALQIAVNVASKGKGVVFGSLEMQSRSLALRAISNATLARGWNTPYASARRGDMQETEMEAFTRSANDIATLPILMTPPTIRTMGGFSAQCQRAERQFDAAGTELGLIVIDYLQLIEHTERSQVEGIGKVSKQIKSLAARHRCPVLALSQLNRGVEARDNKRPTLSDLRDSGNIEQDADVVLFTYRGEYYVDRMRPEHDDIDKMAEWYKKKERWRDLMEIIIAKQRMGAIASIEVECKIETNTVRDRT